eukprot:s5031_g2.t3
MRLVSNRQAAELRVLWTPPYLTRLWCIFELAAYRVANPTGRITLTPIFIEHSVLFLAPALWFASSCYWAAIASGLDKYGYFVGEALPIGLALIPLVGFVHGLRRFFCAKHKLFEELRAFKLASAECSELFDHIFVTSAIQKWYGSAEEFEKFVQETLYSELSNIQTVDVPLPYCLLLVTFPVSVTIDESMALWAGGAPMPVVASSLIGHVYSICVCWCLVSFKLLYYLCDRFAVARRPGFADYLQTLLIYFSFSFFFLVGSYTGELAYRHSLETAICHASICTLAFSREVHCDCLLQALELAGFTILREAWLDEVVSQITRYNSLDLDEFLQMLHMYEEKHYAEFAKVFEHFDDDQSGTLEAHELANLLEQCGITALDQVLKEIMVEVAPADPGSITMEEFKRVIEIIHVNEGFSSREIIKLKEGFALQSESSEYSVFQPKSLNSELQLPGQEVFRKFDLDRGGTMDTSELHKAMAWLGHGLTKEEVQLISDSCDVGGKGVLEECEFFGFMRKVKEKEILMVKRELKKQRPVGGAVYMQKQLDRVLRALGYIPNAQAIRDAAEDAAIIRPNLAEGIDLHGQGIHPWKPAVGGFSGSRRGSVGSTAVRRLSALSSVSGAGRRDSSNHSRASSTIMPGWTPHDIHAVMPKTITISNFFVFLEVYRYREGLDRKQIMELDAAFNKYDRRGFGEIDVKDVGKVLRWMGYPASFDVQQMLVKEVDIDESNTLDAVEMKKLVRKFQEKELTSWTTAFNQSLKKGCSCLEVPACARTLRSLGIKASESEVEEMRASIAASFPSNKNRRFSSIMASTPAEAPAQKLGSPVSLLLSRPSKDSFSLLTSPCLLMHAAALAEQDRISVTSAVNSSSSSFAAISTSSSSEENAESSDDDLEDYSAKGIDLAVFHLICAKLVADAWHPGRKIDTSWVPTECEASARNCGLVLRNPARWVPDRFMARAAQRLTHLCGLLRATNRQPAVRFARCASTAREEHFLDVNGRRLYVLTAGDLQGSPGLPVICLPGAMGTAETDCQACKHIGRARLRSESDFAGQLDGLSQRHAVVAFDPRGYGKSRPPNRRYPADFYHLDASDAGAIMDSLGIGSYNVIGWSDGAISATILASQRPEAVKKLAVFGIQGSITKEDVDAYEDGRFSLHRPAEGLRDVEKAWSKRMLETHRPVYGDDLQPMWSSFCDAMKMMYDAGGDICQKEAKQVKCPTFILHGAKDPLVPSHHPEWFHQAIEASRLHVFPEGKHNIHQKFADEFNKLLLESVCPAEAKLAVRANAGYTMEEVSMMREKFADLCPDMSSNMAKRSEVARILTEVDPDKTGSLDFPDFLRLMRQVDDMQDRLRMAKEAFAVEKTKFSSREVEEFRRIFLGEESEDGSMRGLLRLDEYLEMVGPVVGLGKANLDELTRLFFDIDSHMHEEYREKVVAPLSPKNQRYESMPLNRPRIAVDFPEFLILMQMLLDKNACRIKEQSKLIADLGQRNSVPQIQVRRPSLRLH